MVNFHHHKSFADYKASVVLLGLVVDHEFTQSNLQIGVDDGGIYKVILDSDQAQFGGHGRINQVRTLTSCGSLQFLSAFGSMSREQKSIEQCQIDQN